MSVGHPYILLGKMSAHILSPFFARVVCFFVVELYEFFTYSSLIEYMIYVKHIYVLYIHMMGVIELNSIEKDKEIRSILF